jgi:cell division protein FtsB
MGQTAKKTAKTALWRRISLAQVSSGDRPFLLAGIAAVVLGAVLLTAPLQQYLEVRARVGLLQQQADALHAANTELARDIDNLTDPRHIELLAREQQGFIRPGEVAYSLVPPEVERPQITAPRDRTETPQTSGWQRTFDRILGWFSRS